MDSSVYMSNVVMKDEKLFRTMMIELKDVPLVEIAQSKDQTISNENNQKMILKEMIMLALEEAVDKTLATSLPPENFDCKFELNQFTINPTEPKFGFYKVI